MNKYLMLIVATLTVSQPSMADQNSNNDQILRKLRNEPASMFDLGMYRLEQVIAESWTVEKYDLAAMVLPNADEIDHPAPVIITLYFDVGMFEEPKEKCAEIVSEMRKTHAPLDQIPHLFAHTAYARRGFDADKDGTYWDQNFLDAVEDLFVIRAKQRGKDMECWGSLGGDELTYAKVPAPTK